MDNTTQQQNNQGNLSPEDAKASLGLATRLTEQFLMSKMPPQEAQNATQQAEPLRNQYPAENQDNGKIDAVLSEISSIKEEINNIKKMEEEEAKKEDKEDNQDGQKD